MTTKTLCNPIVTVKTEISIDTQSLSDLLCNAIEGGSNYWCKSIDRVGDSPAEYRHEHPFYEGCSLLVVPSEETEKNEYIVDIQAIRKAVQIMANSYPIAFNDLLNDNADAETGDIFLQLCCFGEVIFG